MSRHALIAKVHIARAQLQIDEADYRIMLNRVTGHASAKDCTDADLVRVLDEFKAKGWQARSPAKSSFKLSNKPHVRKIYAIWGALFRAGIIRDGSGEALRAFVTRQTGVRAPEWLDATEANKVTEALKAMQARGKAPASAP